MPAVLVHHKVRDFASWKPVFEAHGGARKAAGSKGGLLFRNAADPNGVVVLLHWDDLTKARRFVESDDLRQAMERAGVVGQPELVFLEDAGQPAG